MSNILMCGNEPLGLLQGNASDIVFDNSGGGISSNNVQDAIEEINLKQGGDINGHLFIDNHDGTTSTAGESVLLVGNNIAEGTDGNSRGRIRLFANTSNNLDIMPPKNMGVSRQIWFPVPSDNNQTLALRSDIPSVIPKQYLNNIISTDLNNAYADDFIKIGYLQDAGLPLYGNWGMVICVAGSSGTTKVCNQVIIAQNGIATRHYEGSSWSDWKKTSFL